MADTKDVANVLFKWMFGREVDPKWGGVEPDFNVVLRDGELVAKLQHISERYRIGIEDARALLREGNNEQAH